MHVCGVSWSGRLGEWLAWAFLATRALLAAPGCSTGMPKPLSDQAQQTFLAERHVAVLSVARGHGHPPLSTPIWYGYKPGGNLTFFTGANASKLKLIQRAGVVSLTVQREEPPYQYVTIAGTVVSTDTPPASEQIYAIARRYMPEDAALDGFSQCRDARVRVELAHDSARPLAERRLHR
jgi:PPOX class probable F420-dependent enzyme